MPHHHSNHEGQNHESSRNGGGRSDQEHGRRHRSHSRSMSAQHIPTYAASDREVSDLSIRSDRPPRVPAHTHSVSTNRMNTLLQQAPQGRESVQRTSFGNVDVQDDPPSYDNFIQRPDRLNEHIRSNSYQPNSSIPANYERSARTGADPFTDNGQPNPLYYGAIPSRSRSRQPSSSRSRPRQTQSTSQFGSTYIPTDANPPYPDYAVGAIAMPGFEDSAMDFGFSTSPDVDELHLPTLPDKRVSPRKALPSVPTDEDHPDTPPRPPPHKILKGSPSKPTNTKPLPGTPDEDARADQRRPKPKVDTTFEGLDYSAQSQDALFQEVESAIVNASSSPAVFTKSSPLPPWDDSYARDVSLSPRPLSSSRESRRDDYDNDPEAMAGLEAMRIADEQDAAARRRTRPRTRTNESLGRQLSRSRTQIQEDTGGVDDKSNGERHGISKGSSDVKVASISRGNSSTRASLRPTALARQTSYDSTRDMIAPMTPIQSSYAFAQVNDAGTGGFAEPVEHKFEESPYEDDGDGSSFEDEKPFNEIPNQDMFFIPDVAPLYRPLPAKPADTDDGHLRTQTTFPTVPPKSGINDSAKKIRPSASLPRFSSMRELTTTQTQGTPSRSRTDAEKSRRVGLKSSIDFRSPTFSDAATDMALLDLPSLPTKRFNAAKLGAPDFAKCSEPWALSSVHHWLRGVCAPDQAPELKEAMITESLIALFSNKVPTLDLIEAEALAQIVIQELYDSGSLHRVEEWVRLTGGSVSGVIFQLTQGGCYSPSVHDFPTAGRCYSPRCQRTLRKIDLHIAPIRPSEDWVTFYKLKKEDVERLDKKEIEVQFNLHEIVQTEEQFIGQIDVLQTIFRDGLIKSDPPVLEPRRLQTFLRDVFGKIDAVRKANEDNLLAQLKYRQEEQGPWIKGFSDIFRQWIRKAKQAFVDYSAAFPAASLAVRQETERNLEFRAFLDRARTHKATGRLGLDTYLKAPITRLQRYSLLLSVVHKNMKTESSEKKNLQLAIDEIKTVTLACDSRVAEMQLKVEMSDLGQKLKLRPGMKEQVQLNLNQHGRKLLYQGTLQRAGTSRFNFVDCVALLFDHYLILAKPLSVIDNMTGAKTEKYDVSRLPIPMDLLVLENIPDEAVRQSHYLRGLSTVSTMQKISSSNDLTRLRSNSNIGSTTSVDRLTVASSLSSGTESQPPMVTTLGESSKDMENILYPFKIKHLGKETYTLFAQSMGQRNEWATKIIEAKTNHAKSLQRQHAEPFKLRVIADASFYYDSASSNVGSTSILIEDSPMDRAIKSVEQRFKSVQRPPAACRARVNCVTNFSTSHPNSKQMTAIGTDYGLFLASTDNPRGWYRALNLSKVTQMAVLEGFGALIILSGGALISYDLEVVCNPAAADSSNITRFAPQRLSGSKDVNFFTVARIKERVLIFYKKRDGLNSVFKILEPVYRKSTDVKRSTYTRSSIDYYRDYDEFYTPSDCSGISVFTNSIALATTTSPSSRPSSTLPSSSSTSLISAATGGSNNFYGGFEILTLDRPTLPYFSVPDLRSPDVTNIASHISSQVPLSMLKLSDQEFLACYERCAVYVNKNGDVSRSVIMNFVGRAKSAALCHINQAVTSSTSSSGDSASATGIYLVLFDASGGFVEVRDALNGRLKQIIAGKDVRCVDDGGGGKNFCWKAGLASGASTNSASDKGTGTSKSTIKIAMAHPTVSGVQIVVELVVDDKR